MLENNFKNKCKLIFAISMIYTISKFYYNKNMVLGIMISVVFLIELLINEKVDNW